MVDTGFFELHDAAEIGDLDKVRRLVEDEGVDVNVKKTGVCQGRTPLHGAARHGNVAEFLVGKGAEVDAKDILGETPLHWAAFHGKLDVAEFLVDKGAEVDAKADNGQTPLHEAARDGDLYKAEFLVGKGAEVDAKDNDGKTPLHLAARKGKLNVAEFLVGKGADVNAKEKDGSTPLHLAAQEEKLDVAEFLVGKGAEVDAKNYFGWAPLLLAAQEGKLDVVEFLVGKGADVNEKAEDGWTPLHWAARNGKLDVATFLVGKGAEVDAKANDGKTPLRCAMEARHSDIVTFLLSRCMHGKDLAVCDDEQCKRVRREDRLQRFIGQGYRVYEREAARYSAYQRYLVVWPSAAMTFVSALLAFLSSAQATGSLSEKTVGIMIGCISTIATFFGQLHQTLKWGIKAEAFQTAAASYKNLANDLNMKINDIESSQWEIAVMRMKEIESSVNFFVRGWKWNREPLPDYLERTGCCGRIWLWRVWWGVTCDTDILHLKEKKNAFTFNLLPYVVRKRMEEDYFESKAQEPYHDGHVRFKKASRAPHLPISPCSIELACHLLGGQPERVRERRNHPGFVSYSNNNY